MQIITFSGRAGSGKNYSASILENKLEQSMNKDVHELAYGNAVKTIAFQMGWNGVKDDAGRKLLQDIGESGRRYNKDTWVNKVIENIYYISGYNDDVVICITDARFPDNEIVNIQNEFGKNNVISIKVNGRHADMGELENDISETSMDNFDYDFYLDNSPSNNNLEDQIEELLKQRGLI